MRYTDLRTTEADKTDVWSEDDEILQCYACQRCGRDGWASVREKVATMIVCGDCGARKVVIIALAPPLSYEIVIPEAKNISNLTY